MLFIFIDADMLCFVSCSSVEREINWGDGLWTLHADAKEAETQIDDRVKGIVTTVLDKLDYEGEYRIIMCISDPKVTFRKKILSTYKANRIGKRKPVCYSEVLEWIKRNYTTKMIPTLEADDVIGIAATHFKGQEVHCSGDKDFRSIPGIFYNFLKGELYHISEREADKWFYTQTLIGDKADNYDGCPGIGEKTAEKIFKKEGVSWGTVKKTFLRKGLTEEDALQQARVARILRDTEWKDGKPILWSPSK
jgi:DNA polymerase-1